MNKFLRMRSTDRLVSIHDPNRIVDRECNACSMQRHSSNDITMSYHMTIMSPNTLVSVGTFSGVCKKNTNFHDHYSYLDNLSYLKYFVSFHCLLLLSSERLNSVLSVIEERWRIKYGVGGTVWTEKVSWGDAQTESKSSEQGEYLLTRTQPLMGRVVNIMCVHNIHVLFSNILKVHRGAPSLAS